MIYKDDAERALERLKEYDRYGKSEYKHNSIIVTTEYGPVVTFYTMQEVYAYLIGLQNALNWHGLEY